MEPTIRDKVAGILTEQAFVEKDVIIKELPKEALASISVKSMIISLGRLTRLHREAKLSGVNGSRTAMRLIPRKLWSERKIKTFTPVHFSPELEAGPKFFILGFDSSSFRSVSLMMTALTLICNNIKGITWED